MQYLITVMLLKLPSIGEQRIWMHQVADFLMFGLSLFLVLQLVTTLIAERCSIFHISRCHAKIICRLSWWSHQIVSH